MDLFADVPAAERLAEGVDNGLGVAKSMAAEEVAADAQEGTLLEKRLAQPPGRQEYQFYNDFDDVLDWSDS